VSLRDNAARRGQSRAVTPWSARLTSVNGVSGMVTSSEWPTVTMINSTSARMGVATRSRK